MYNSGLQDYPSSDAPWVVQSFSEDSITASTSKMVSEILLRNLNDFRTVIVCSACIEQTSETSQLLIRAASKARRHRVGSPRSSLPQEKSPGSGIPSSADLFQLEYSNLGQKLIINGVLLIKYQRKVHKQCDWLRLFLSGSEDSEGISNSDEDVLTGLSETLSSILLEYILLDRGYEPELIFAEDIEASIQADATSQPWMDLLTEALAQKVRASHPRVPIVTGRLSYRGVPKSDEGGFAESLSVLLSIGLQAVELQLWTTNTGVLTADARRVSAARVIPSISQKQAVELAQHGHPCVSSVILDKMAERDMTVRLGNSNNETHPGTTIESPFPPLPPLPSLSPTKPLRLVRSMPQVTDRRPMSLIVKDSVFMITITAYQQFASNPLAFSYDVFRVLETHGVRPDIMSSAQTFVALTFEEEPFQSDINSLTDELGRYGIVFVNYNLSTLTVIGPNSNGLSGSSPSTGAGAAGHLVSTLTQGGVKVNMVGPGTGTSVSCVIGARDLDRAVRLVHHTMFRKIRRG